MMEPCINSSDNDQLHLLDLLIVLAKHSRTIIYASFGGMVLVFLVLSILPNKYIATARVLPPQQNLTMSAQLLSSLGGGSAGAPVVGAGLSGMGPSLLGLKSSGELYAGILTGNTVYDRIIDRFDLRKLYGENYIETARKTLGQNTVVSADRDGLISVQVTDKDPKRAAAMANAFIEELDQLLQRLSVQEAKSRLAFLERERLQTIQNLTKAENDLRSFSEQNSVIQIDTQTRGALEYIAQLRAEIDAKEVRIQVLRQQATPNNYDVVRLETEIKGLRDKLSVAEKQYDQACGGDVCLTTAKVPALGLEYMRHFREVKFQDALYQLYTKMMELARLDMMKDYSVVQVVDKALPPEKPSNKRLLWSLFAGGVTGLIMVFFAFGYEFWNAKSQEEDFRRLSSLRDNLRQWAHPFRR